MFEKKAFNPTWGRTVVEKAHKGEILALGNYVGAVNGLKEYAKTITLSEIEDVSLRNLLENLPRFNGKIWEAYREACRRLNMHSDAHEEVKEARGFLLRINQILSRYGVGTDWDENLSIAAMLHLCTDFLDFERSFCERYFGFDVARFIFDMPQESEGHFKECKTKLDRQKKISDYLNRFVSSPIPSILILCAVQIDAIQTLSALHPVLREKVWRKLDMPNKSEQLWYFNQIVEVFSSNEALKAHPDY